MKKSIVTILLALVMLSCKSIVKNSEFTNVDFTLIAKDNLYGAGEEGIVEQNLIISNQSAWNDLIAQMNAVNNVSDNFTETDINFSEYTIIAVFDEVKGSGGYGLELQIRSNSDNITVKVTDIIPEGNATSVMTQPFYIVKIQNSDLPIVFE